MLVAKYQNKNTGVPCNKATSFEVISYAICQEIVALLEMRPLARGRNAFVVAAAKFMATTERVACVKSGY